ncbi:hypothetical protein BC940DRAFT_366527 [Gongronella butleri]|nr:hypothetical protein BC940DRAFT_366527 [Gongronella butleri]
MDIKAMKRTTHDIEPLASDDVSTYTWSRMSRGASMLVQPNQHGSKTSAPSNTQKDLANAADATFQATGGCKVLEVMHGECVVVLDCPSSTLRAAHDRCKRAENTISTAGNIHHGQFVLQQPPMDQQQAPPPRLPVQLTTHTFGPPVRVIHSTHIRASHARAASNSQLRHRRRYSEAIGLRRHVRRLILRAMYPFPPRR